MTNDQGRTYAASPGFLAFPDGVLLSPVGHWSLIIGHYSEVT
jgi:hypothetical protein